jgi:putative ABC transport system permease protein
MGALAHDLKFGIRMLAKNPGFTAVAMLTLALGIGANTAIFSVINAVLLQPLPFKDPGRLVQLWETEAAPGTYPFAGPDYLDWQRQNRTLEGSSLYTWGRGVNASGSGEPETASAIATQANFFSVLGVQPRMGRAFASDEDQAGKTHVAVLSNSFWQRHFGGDSSAIGKNIQLNSESYTVIGVMPRSFNFPPSTDIWTPFEMSEKNLGPRGSHSYRAIGRLKPGVSVSQALADLTTVAKRLEQQYPNSNEKVSAVVVSMKEEITKDSREQLCILLGAVALVLLIACANVANLLLARASGRQREVALRAVLGASRWRLARQLLTETVLLSLSGAALGLGAAWWCVSALESVKALPIPRENPVQIDIAVLFFTMAISFLVGILFGLAPALHASQLDLSEELKSSAQAVLSPSGWRRAMRDALVIGEIATSLSLLVGAGLLLRSFARLRNTEIGVQSENILTLGVNLPATKYSTLAMRREFFDQFLERVERTPGVVAASVSTEIPLEGGTNGYISVEGRDDAALQNQLVEYNYITPAYFRAFGVPFREGQNFSPQEVARVGEVNLKLAELFQGPTPPKELPKDLVWVAVINSAMARTVWPNQDPIGKVFMKSGILPVRVIGVVGDAKVSGIREAVMPEAYFPATGAGDNRDRSWRLVVKTSVPPMSALGAIRSSLNALDSGLAIFKPRTMDDVISESMQDLSLQTVLLGVFAVLATLLAAVGLYSVMAYLVTQRTHEIGVRMALGAQQRDVLQLVVRQGSRLIFIGVGTGIAAALALTRLMSSLLFGVTASDPVTFVGVAILLAVIAVAACYIPARRATRVDPMVALRYE